MCVTICEIAEKERGSTDKMLECRILKLLYLEKGQSVQNDTLVILVPVIQQRGNGLCKKSALEKGGPGLFEEPRSCHRRTYAYRRCALLSQLPMQNKHFCRQKTTKAWSKWRYPHVQNSFRLMPQRTRSSTRLVYALEKPSIWEHAGRKMQNIRPSICCIHTRCCCKRDSFS